ncbi:hypothetical protein [Rhizobium laguerreae]|uniref:hypothetical protein n=1 Tax=Rhizobium laguerreae TaxID=1076926 RepID=UPI001C927252|nr:hypothetical protein [Rhizobium laguerreae]MBY3387609.1 hypothetical protein [Rhizobium laguerreae]MBY3401359.1 hypothetical protein [Rhizobium laguerreae]MBY3408297.1 hypothetical protein [Rhizobium laguerreae]
MIDTPGHQHNRKQDKVSPPFVAMGVGGQYPYPIRFEGAMAHFLIRGGNMLQIGMPDISKAEAMQIRKGKLKAGFIKDGPSILLIFQFGEDFIVHCPFDVRLIPKTALDLPDITNDRQRLAVDIHLVDLATNAIRGLRRVTLPPALTVEFLAAAQDQLADQRKADEFERKYWSMPLKSLARSTKLYACGV